MRTIQRKLFFTPTSPYARKVRVCAAVQNVPLLCVEANPFEDVAEVLKEAPMARVPALVTSVGTFHDSRAICQHLGMVAGDPADLELLSLGDGLMDAAVAAVLEARRPGMGFGGGNEAWIARQLERVERLLDVLSNKAPTPSARWSMGSISLAVALAYLDFRHPSVAWRKRRELAEFAHSHFERDVMQATRFPT